MTGTGRRTRRIATIRTIHADLFNTGVLALAVDMAVEFVWH